MGHKISASTGQKSYVFPLWGTCLGFEMMSYISSSNSFPLTRCQSSDQATNLQIDSLGANWVNSAMGKDMPAGWKLIFKMSFYCLVIKYLNMETFLHHINYILSILHKRIFF